MSFNDPEIAPYLDGEFVKVAMLFKIELASGTLFYALQNTPFTDTTGQVWEPANADVITFDDFPLMNEAIAQKRTYRIALGDASLGNRIVSSEAEYRGRKITQFMQILAPDRTPVSTPKFLHVGFMDVATVSVSAGNATLSITCEGLFTAKDKTPYGFLTDADQKARHTGDRGLERVTNLQKGVTVPWPPV